MNREDILAAARENKMKNEEYERNTLLKGDNFSIVFGMILGAILFLTEWIVKKEMNMGLATMYFVISSIQLIYEGVKLEKKSCIIWGIFIAVLAAIALVVFIGMMVKA
jgi:uncharacterized membrane protein (UPF0136 family)